MVAHVRSTGNLSSTKVKLPLVIYNKAIIYYNILTPIHYVECGSSVVERRTRNQVSPGFNPPLVPFRRLGIFVLSIDAPVDSAVLMSTWL